MYIRISINGKEAKMDYYEAPKIEHVQYVNETNSVKSKREEVRAAYEGVAKANKNKSSCGNDRSCCGLSSKPDSSYSEKLGYSKEEIESVPEEANMGLGCGNPNLSANLTEGEVVLDLGSGGGFDAFLAARRVGPNGKVYGVDMTHDMLSTARKNAEMGGYKNVEFLLGEIEHLPLANDSIDVIISNCVINLSTDKAKVFNESFRVLKEGGRIAISDVIANVPLPKGMVDNKELYCNCISGAITSKELKDLLSKAGFTDIVIETNSGSKSYIKDWVPGAGSEDYVVSATIKAVKAKS